VYPYPAYPSALGVAPEGTILAAGTGTADMKADGSDRTTAMNKATVLAMADARAQATVVATSMGVQVKDVYSVSISSSDSYTYPIDQCAVPLLPVPDQSGSSTGSSGGAEAGGGTLTAPAATPLPCIQSTATAPTSAQLVVTVIVAYRFG
jgi:hypothetical protein